MRLRGHQQLDLDRTLYVKRATESGVMRFGTTTIEVGGVFPWRELKVPERTVRLLHDQRRIGHEKPGERNGAELPARHFAKHPVAAPASKAPAQPQRSQRR